MRHTPEYIARQARYTRRSEYGERVTQAELRGAALLAGVGLGALVAAAGGALWWVIG